MKSFATKFVAVVGLIVSIVLLSYPEQESNHASSKPTIDTTTVNLKKVNPNCFCTVCKCVDCDCKESAPYDNSYVVQLQPKQPTTADVEVLALRAKVVEQEQTINEQRQTIDNLRGQIQRLTNGPVEQPAKQPTQVPVQAPKAIQYTNQSYSSCSGNSCGSGNGRFRLFGWRR